MKITVASKQPPGGRCKLYTALAEAAAEVASAETEVYYPVTAPDDGGPAAPAMLVDGRVVEPADGVILSPDELSAAMVEGGFEGDAEALLQALEAAQDRIMEEWGDG